MTSLNFKPLGEVCDFYNGKAHEKAITEEGRYKVINSKFISSEGKAYKLTDNLMFPLYKGDLCLVMSDVPNGKTLAKCFLVDADETYSLNQRICTIRTDNFDLKFLYYQLNRHPFLLSFNNGENQTNLRKADILSCPLWVPPIPEQKRIVAILDQALAEIEQARAKTEQNLKNARELFESYLQQVFSQRGEGVIEVPLSEITESISDGDHAAPPKSEEGIPFITISNINKLTNEIDFTNTFKVPDSYYSALKITRKPLQGDVLYTVTGSYGIPVIVKEEKEFCFQRHIGLVRPNNDTDSNWLYYLLMSPQVFKQADEGATGTAQKTVSLKLLRGLRVPKVPLKEQVNMVEDLNLMYLKSKQLTEIYTRKLESLNELKNTILQKAFSGELTKTLEGGTNKGAVA